MLTKIWTGFWLVLLAISLVALVVAVAHEKNFHPLRDCFGRVRRLPLWKQLMVIVFVGTMWAYASIKPGDISPERSEHCEAMSLEGCGGNGDGGDGGGDGGTNNVPLMVPGPGVGNLQPMNFPGGGMGSLTQGFQGGSRPLSGGEAGDPSSATDQWSDITPITSTNTTRTLDGDDFRRGFILTRIGTDEQFDFTPSPNATIVSDWRAFGAATDWIYAAFTNWTFKVAANDVSRLRVYSFGKVRPCVTNGTVGNASGLWFAPFLSLLGVVPESNWSLVAGNENAATPEDIIPSQFWHFVTSSNTLQLTWQNVLFERLTNTPVSVQMEMWPSGRFAYRYDLSRLGVEAVTNILVGACFGGLEWATNSVPTNLTSLAFHPLSEEDILNQDRDGDGLRLIDELFVYGTDPLLWDSDFDGASDGAEVAAGTNPHTRDSDGDGLVDGSDPDPAVQTSLADLDGDGIPDAYEDYWFGGTTAVDTAEDRDGTGFTLDAKILGGINPTNEAAAANVVSTNTCVSWHLFDGFSLDLPPGATNLVWERTFAINRSSAWQQFFLSASSAVAGAWSLYGAVLEWETDTGAFGCSSASPVGDSYRIPLAADDLPNTLTLRLRATGGSTVHSSTPLNLVAYLPEFRIEGGSEITGQSGAKFVLFTEGSDSQIRLIIDHSLRPCSATPGSDEGDMTEFEGMSTANGEFSFSGDATGGTIMANRPGIYTLPDFSLGVSVSAPLRSPPRRSPRRGGGGGSTIVVLDPSVGWTCYGHGCGYDGLGYDWYGDSYYEEDYYPLDTKCLRKKWYRDWGGGWYHDNCDFWVSSGLGDDSSWVTTTTDGSTGKVYVDGVEVWSGSAEHTYDDTGCGGYREEYLGDGCGGCDEDCANGNCDSLEGPGLGSLKFRIPLGAPVKGQVAGFVWFSTDGPIAISKSTFQLLAHPEADVSDYSSSGTRRVVCYDSRGRDVRIENISNGARVTIYETAAQTLEHIWEIVNVNGSSSQVRLRKISRLNNVMSDETYTYADGDWARFDNIAGVGTELTTYNDFADYGDGVKGETRTTTDVGGNVLSSVTTEQCRIGECDNAVLRETYRSESTGWGWKWSQADYWNDPAHSGRHGQPRLVYGNARAWVYTDYDENGHETLRIEQRGSASVPSAFPFVVSNQLCNASALADAFVTVRDFTPPSGDSGHQDDAARPRMETRYVVTNGVATLVGRTWTRYTRLNRDGYAAIKAETWRAGAQGAAAGDAGNAYSYKITYADTGDGTPLLMRNAVSESLDEDGVLTLNYWFQDGNVLTQASHKSHRSRFFPVYEVVERDAVHGTVLRRTTRLSAGDTAIADERSVYDEKNRLRSTTYIDGTSLTNAYSCCRLLWSRDREGRKTLRSAQTGTDQLYHATEDVWLADVGNGVWGTGNGANGFRVTQHFYDALGRETNTIVGISYTPGSSTSPTSTLHFTLYTLHSSYPYGGDDCVVSTDERNAPAAEPSGSPNAEGMSRDSGRKRVRKVTIARTDVLPGCIERGEAVFTNGVEVVKTKRRAYFGGGSSMRREWGDDQWTEERRFDDYLADGRRVAYVVTASSDCGVVTNSVSTYDFLGRLVSSAVPGANGSTIVTANAYDGASSRVLASTFTAGDVVRTMAFLYDDCGEQVGAVLDGITNRTETSYETDSSNVVWRVETSTAVGPSTNSMSVTRIRLTGLSDSCRRQVVTFTGATGASPVAGLRTETTTVCDSTTGIVTETVTSSAAVRVVRQSRHGVLLSEATGETTIHNAYDVLGRLAATSRDIWGAGVSPVQNFAYSPAGDLVAQDTYTNVADVVTETYAYDQLGNRVTTTDAFGNAVHKAYDPLGNVVAEWGATYPVRYEYDTQSRRTALATTRDGTIWDVTRWTYDAATSLCTAKTYADGSTIRYTYTPDNLPLRTSYASGRWTENVYNARRQIVGTLSSDGANDATMARDAFGRIVEESNLVATAVYLLADSGTATNEAVSVGEETIVLTRTRDDQNRVNGLAIPDSGYAQSYVYNADGNLAAISNALAVVTYLYTPDRLDAGYSITLANGVAFTRSISRDDCRRSLATHISSVANGVGVGELTYTYDALNRPTRRNDDIFGYNARGEVVAAMIDGNVETHGYDFVGNSLLSTFNAATNVYAANRLNQYTSILRAAAPPCEPTYDLDGNLLFGGVHTYTYDSANRLATVASNGFLLVTNHYDAKSRRVKKVTPEAITTFFYDDWNLIEERIVYTNGTTLTVHYFWGKDLSGTFQGAGGVGGLLYLAVDGDIYIPCYDNNGNVTRYFDANGSSVAQYTYDAFGHTISQTGSLSNFFRHRFSTKYFDVETGKYYYGYRFYSSSLMRWLNRDPFEEQGGLNIYAFCRNNALVFLDKDGQAYFAKRALSRSSWKKNLSQSSLLDPLNIEWSHEQLFFGTPDKPLDDVGYFDDGKVKRDPLRDRYNYVVTDSGYDDCVMRKAVAQVKPDPYFLAPIPWLVDNCQSYAEKLRRKYWELMKDKSVQCECFGRVLQ